MENFFDSTESSSSVWLTCLWLFQLFSHSCNSTLRRCPFNSPAWDTVDEFGVVNRGNRYAFVLHRTCNHSINGPIGLNVCWPLLMWFNLHCRHRLFSINRLELYSLCNCMAISLIPLGFHKMLRRRESFSSQKVAMQLHLISNFGRWLWGGLMSVINTSNDEHSHDYRNQAISIWAFRTVTSSQR